jgi:hypothetical protein
MQEVRVELQQRNELVATLDAQLLESNEMVAHLKQLQAQASSRPRSSSRVKEVLQQLLGGWAKLELQWEVPCSQAKLYSTTKHSSPENDRNVTILH